MLNPAAPSPEVLCMVLAMAGVSISPALARVLVALPPRDAVRALDAVFGQDFTSDAVRSLWGIAAKERLQ